MVQKKVLVSSGTISILALTFLQGTRIHLRGKMCRHQGHYMAHCFWGKAAPSHSQRRQLGNIHKWRHLFASNIHMLLYTYTHILTLVFISISHLPCSCHYFFICYKTKLHCYFVFFFFLGFASAFFLLYLPFRAIKNKENDLFFFILVSSQYCQIFGFLPYK